jgi:hypothetical protein
MATAMTPAQWRAALNKWRVDYSEYPGWTGRGRPGDFAPRGVMVHHTGSDSGQSSSYDDFLFAEGRPDLPAPLCNVATDMDGDLHVGADGRANHAGAGSQSVLNAVTFESHNGYVTELDPGTDGPIGNGYFYGNEVKYDGGQPMTPAQYRTAVLTAAAICDHHGWTALSVIGHREWTRRKPDPGNCNMAKFRRDVRDTLAVGPTPPPPPPEEDMPLTQAEIEAVATASASKVIYGLLSNGDTVNNVLVTGFGRITHTYDTLRENGNINSQLDAIHAKVNEPLNVSALAAAIVAAMPANGDVDQATVEAGVRAVLGTLDNG